MIEMVNRGLPWDIAIFSDTRGEKPETYTFLGLFNRWLRKRNRSWIELVEYEPPIAPYRSLEEACLHNDTLPSIAYGFKSCSEKWKQRPQHQRLLGHPDAIATWERGERVHKYIGFHHGEQNRINGRRAMEDKYHFVYPLDEWGFDQDDCLRTIKEAGLPLPSKSACFFCPSSKKHEILWLAEHHPELYQRALAMEEKARDGKHGLQTVKGLGRNFSWRDVVEKRSLPVMVETDVPCGCHDGDDE